MENNLRQAMIDMVHFDPEKSNCKWDKKEWELISEHGITQPKELPEVCKGCRYIMSCMTEKTQYLLDDPENNPDFQVLLEAAELNNMDTWDKKD